MTSRRQIMQDARPWGGPLQRAPCSEGCSWWWGCHNVNCERMWRMVDPPGIILAVALLAAWALSSL